MTNPSPIPARIESIDDRAGHVRIVTLTPEHPFIWHAGQYAHLGGTGARADGLGMRPYSIASCPGNDGTVTFHIRSTGRGFSKYLNDARVGDTILLEGPFGAMTTEHARNRPVIMVAGGTGIAPMLGLASDILKRGLTEDGITLIYGARSDHDIYCRRELDALTATGEVALHIAIGAHTPDQEIRKIGPNLAHHIAYISGPGPMILSARKALEDHLADPSRIFTDVSLDDLQKNVK